MASIKIKFALVIFCLFIATVASIKKPNFKLTSRIVKGFDANRNQFPYFASLSFVNGTLRVPNFCGGVVISQWHILTAAHCVGSLKYFPNHLEVDLGKHLFADNGVIVAEIEKIIPHPFYEEEFLHNDIVLLKMVNEIEFSSSVRAIALPQSNVDSEGGQKAVVCGFGALYNAQPSERVYPKVLQYQETNTISPADCESKYSRTKIFRRKTWQIASMMLANGKKFCVLNSVDNAVSFCHGDSGGPLVFNNNLIGVVSASQGCASGYPDFYENVYEHLDWIRDEMKNSIKKRRKTRTSH